MEKKRKGHVLPGTLSKHRKGFGFVMCDDIEQDVFIAPDSLSLIHILAAALSRQMHQR